MARCLLCLALLLLVACSGTPASDVDPAYPDAQTYQAYIRQHLMLTEGKILVHFPGLLECEVEQSIEGYTPEEMRVLDAYAQDRDSSAGRLARKAQRAHADRTPAGQFAARHPECVDIRAQPGAFVDGGDYLMQSFLNRNEPVFNQKGVTDELRQEAAVCYWDFLKTRLSPEEQQSLDGFARGGPRPTSFIMPYVDRFDMRSVCPKAMARLDQYFTVNTYYYYPRDYFSTWPGRS